MSSDSDNFDAVPDFDVESGILDEDNIGDMNIRINPNYYIHTALIKAQQSLMLSAYKGSIKDGITAFRIFIEHIEVLCKAADLLDSTYEKQIEDFKNSDEFKTSEKDIQEAKLANKKVEILMRQVFHRGALSLNLQF